MKSFSSSSTALEELLSEGDVSSLSGSVLAAAPWGIKNKVNIWPKEEFTCKDQNFQQYLLWWCGNISVVWAGGTVQGSPLTPIARRPASL